MNNIKALREKTNLSQEEVASAVEVTPQAVSKWERGESDPKWSMAPILAQVLDCTIDELFRREAG